MPQLSLSFILTCSLMGCIAFYLARKKGHNPYLWFVIGFALGLVGIFFLFLPAKQKNVATPPLPNPKTPHPMLSKFWYYLDENNSPVGPMSSSALLDLWKEGKVTQETYVWSEDLPDWKLFKELEEVFSQDKTDANRLDTAKI